MECLLDDAVAVLRLAIVAGQHGFGSLGAKGVIRKAGHRDAASDTTRALHVEHDGDADDGVPGSRMAKLAVACACTLVQRNARAHQNLFGTKIVFEESLEEVFCRDGTLAIRTRQIEHRVQRQHRGRPVGGRVAMHDCATERAAVAHRRVGDQGRHQGNQR